MRKPSRWPVGLAWLSLAATSFGAAALWLLGDRWWLTVPWLYGPRWLAVAALLGNVPLLVSAPRRGARLLLATAGVLWFGVLGGVVGLGRLIPARDGTLMRIATFNIQAGNDRDAEIGTWLAAAKVEIAILSECRGARGGAIATAAGMVLKQASSLCLLSRHPLGGASTRDPREFWREYGSGVIVRATVEHPTAGALHIGMVHLATPRHVLDHFYDLSSIPTLGDTVNRNIDLRNRESAAARGWIGGPDSVDIVAGDFNLPVESAIYRRHWGAFTNAFSRAGWGLGHTKRTRLIGVRIDHLLLGDRVHVRRSWVGPALGSDHRPVVADVVITK